MLTTERNILLVRSFLCKNEKTNITKIKNNQKSNCVNIKGFNSLKEKI